MIFDIRMQCRLEYIRMNNHFGLVKVYVFTERCILFIYLFIYLFSNSPKVDKQTEPLVQVTGRFDTKLFRYTVYSFEV